MIIRAAMIELMLARRGFEVELVGDSEFAVEHVRLYRGGAGEARTLYLETENTPRFAPPRTGSCACLRIAPRSSTIPDSRSSVHRIRTASPGSATVVEEAYEALLELASWEASLKDELLKGVSLDEFIEKGADMICRPIAYFDRNLITLATSSDYWERGELIDGAHPGDQMPPSIAVDLVEDIDYLRAAEHHEGFYYESAQHRLFYGVNTFDGDEYLARLVISLAKGEQRLHRGEEQLIDVYHAYLDDLHLRYAGNAQIASSQNDSLHILIRAELMGTESHLKDEAATILDSFGWSHDDRFIVVKLVFFEGVHWDTVSLYLCSLLERMVSGSCAFPDGRQIVWMVNLTRAAQPRESFEPLVERITKSLVAILRDYACKAGLSGVFNSFAGARVHYVEANRALEVGQVRDPHYWYYRFGDYAFDYLLSRCVEELTAEQMCHPALEALLAHDVRHGTDFARTLVCFLRNSQNTTHAAAELFIHRTSFMRRMASIEKLANVNLNDSDEVLHLLLSAKLLGM